MPNYRASRYHRLTSRTAISKIRWASQTQREVFEYGPAPLCASGGYGAAKTWAFCFKALYLSDLFPNNRGLIARKRWTELQKTTMATFFKICPPEAYSYGGRRSDSEKILRLNNGSEIIWAHMDDPETENLIRGLEINWFYLDQAEEVEEEIFDHLCSRLGRWDKASVPQWLIDLERSQGNPWFWRSPEGRPIPPTYPMISCNPDVEFHWIYRRFHPNSPDHQEKYAAQGYKMFTMSSLDNRFLTQQNKEALLSKDDSFKRRFVFGQWGIPEGQIHQLSALSLVPGTTSVLDWIRTRCTLHRILDHGDTSPTAVLWAAVTPGGDIIVYREYYKPNEIVSTHRQNLYLMSLNERYSSNLADPQIFRRLPFKRGGRWCVADEYSDSTYAPDTAIWWYEADNNELGTRNRINEYLRVDPNRVNPFTGIKGSPRLFFITRTDEYPEGCDMVIRELRSQRRVRLGTDLGKPIFSDDREGSIPDHAYDCLRYFVASRPSARKEEARTRAAEMTFDAIRSDSARRFKPKRLTLLTREAHERYFTITRKTRRSI